MRPSDNSATKNIIDILRNTFRHLEASEINQNDPHLIALKGHLVRSIKSLEDSLRVRSQSRKLVA